MKFILFTITCLSLSAAVTAQESISKVDVSIFPKPEKGFKLMVIEVPHSNLDAQKKISFSAGKYIETDSCNQYGLSGSFEIKDLQGWGYNYYIFKSNGNILTTNMACSDTKSMNRFVSGQSQTIDYNGKMPVVIYVPEDFDVHFKIYESKNEDFKASEYNYKK